MTTFEVPEWRFVHVGYEGSAVSIRGVDPWRYDWRSRGDAIEVPHPSHPSQTHVLQVWTIETDGGAIPFAAGELSNGVWCFYEPESTH